MEITVEQAVSAVKAIEGIKEVNLPAKLSFRLGRLIDKTKPISDRFEETRNKLVTEKYGVASETDENKFSVKRENLGEFLKEVDSLLNTKEDIGTFELINIEMFGMIELPIEFFDKIKTFITE